MVFSVNGFRKLLKDQAEKPQRPDKGGVIYKPLEPLGERLAAWRTVIDDPRQIAIYDRVAESIDPERYAALQKKYAAQIRENDQRATTKYLDLAPWFMIHSRLVRLLDLDRRPPCSILDIGSGGGQFLAIAKAYGHRTLAFDMPEPDHYRDLLALFGIDRVEGAVELGKALPAAIGKFDLIVINGQVFDVFEDRSRRWRLPEWAGFIRHLCAHHLDYPAELFIGLNKSDGPTGTEEFYWPLVELAEKHGAVVDRRYATMDFKLERPLTLDGIDAVEWKPPSPR
ncbi:class I SAM-dependent methyltransferase [Parasphingopyxis algicola]|uniref:class I SAM-dependent methyltransferase n=1 Tax=Parasphingopyxis algicola TaxID=2026624 RepID=UPI0015A3E407|nr:class I SAM-dependent methyltransferase [Parasphingopyxis algicola]QLC24435.1 class I SAM-dependent methyltransferase [Parasphingopyxis algicola]